MPRTARAQKARPASTNSAAAPAPAQADAPTIDFGDLDLGHLALFVGHAVNTEVERALADKGYGDLRASHGYLVQHLVAGPRPIGDLAQRMGVTQQAVSKAVAELESLGYLERAADDDDKRVTRVGLAPRGREVVAVARRTRVALEKRLVKSQGEAAVAAARATLASVLELLGGADAVRERRVRQPR